jgi:hypothetical protein
VTTSLPGRMEIADKGARQEAEWTDDPS